FVCLPSIVSLCPYTSLFRSLPAHVRHVVEICFKEGILDTLFCTTTLMQGVNLPAKNIIIWNPKVGDEKLSGYDYTNLRGRAGRLDRKSTRLNSSHVKISYAV